MDLSIKELKCPKCGASVSPEKHVCDYCGTYYVVEGKAAYILDSRPATDANLARYLEREKMTVRHLEETGHYKRYVSEEEVSHYAFMARDHLREELGREPTIHELNGRLAAYLQPIKQQRIGKEIDSEMTSDFLTGIFIFIMFAILSLIVFFWFISNF